jgi:hypothetical protein
LNILKNDERDKGGKRKATPKSDMAFLN